jgi:hypothetical protein
MPLGIWNLEWLNANSQRSYPLAEFSTKVDTTGTFTIPDSLILGLYLPIHSGIVAYPENFYIKSISVFATGLNVEIGYWDGATGITVASSTIAFSAHSEYKTYSLAGEGTFIDCFGKIVFGKLDELNSIPAGSYNFSFSAGQLDTDSIRPMIRGVSSVTLVNGAATSKRLQGDISFVAGANMSITAAGSAGNYSITFNAISGAGLTVDCNCIDDNDLAACIRTINGIKPDGGGNFTLVGDDCITLDNIDSGLKLNDVCSKPCCGCSELQAVTSDLARFGDAATSLTNFLNRLEGSVNRMNLTVLGSRLGDSPQSCSG